MGTVGNQWNMNTQSTKRDLWPHRAWGAHQPAGRGSGADCWGSPGKKLRWQQSCNESERPPGSDDRFRHTVYFNVESRHKQHTLWSWHLPGWMRRPGCTGWTTSCPTLWSSSAATRNQWLQTSCHRVGWQRITPWKDYCLGVNHASDAFPALKAILLIVRAAHTWKTWPCGEQESTRLSGTCWL